MKKTEKAKTVRLSVSFDEADYEELQRLAEQKKVSVAWVVREAVERYLSNRNPLFRSGSEETSAGRGSVN